jgi:hypothetical protein
MSIVNVKLRVAAADFVDVPIIYPALGISSANKIDMIVIYP